MRPSEIVTLLKAWNLSLCAVESCTGGLIAASLTDVSGSSEVFWGGFVTYDNSAKIALGVPPDVLTLHGAVSREVAEAMAACGLAEMTKALDSPWASIRTPKLLASLATTGIAGPSGGTLEKPVGLCWVALAITEAGEIPKLVSREIRSVPENSRSENRRLFCEAAWELLDSELRARSSG